MGYEDSVYKHTHRILRFYQRSDLEAKLNEMEAALDGITAWQTVTVTPVVVGPDVVYIAHVVITEEVKDDSHF